MKTWIAGSCPGCGKTQMRTTDEPDPECEGCAAPAQIAELTAEIERLRVVLDKLTNEYLSPSEVCTIAREALENTPARVNLCLNAVLT